MMQSKDFDIDVAVDPEAAAKMLLELRAMQNTPGARNFRAIMDGVVNGMVSTSIANVEETPQTTAHMKGKVAGIRLVFSTLDFLVEEMTKKLAELEPKVDETLNNLAPDAP